MKKLIFALFITIFAISTPATAKKSSTEAYLEALHNQGKERVIIRFKDKIDTNLVEKYQGKVIRKLKIINAVVCEIDQDSIEPLKQEENVKDAVPDMLISVPKPQREIAYPKGEWEEKIEEIAPLAYDGNVPIEWNCLEAGINAEAAWDNYDIDGNGIKIALVDTGIQYDMNDFVNNYLGGWDFVDDDNEPLPLNADEWHGQSVASTAIAEGVSEIIGTAYKAKYYSIRVMDQSGGTVSDAISGIEWAIDPDGDPNTDDKADIINMSFGTYGSSPLWPSIKPVFEAAINAAYDAGIILVAGSGNDGYSYSLWPARFGNVISVGGHAEDQTLYDRNGYSSNGGVDIIAPGEYIKTIDPNGVFWHDSGTSFASPHASALIALQLQYARQNGIETNNGYNWEVMKHSAHHLAGETYDPVYQGEGKIYAAQTDINDANIGSIDLLASNWPIDYEFEFLDYAFIDNNVPVYQIGQDVNQTITLTNITDTLGNAVEDIEDLIVTATHVYYGQPNEPNLPGDSVKIFPTVSLLEPNDSNSVTLSYIYTIPPETTPGLKRTTLGLAFNFVGNTRVMSIAHNKPDSFWYAAIPADLDLQDDVDLIDFGILAKKWQDNNCTEPNWCERADVDRSGNVGLSDVNILTQNWLIGVKLQDFRAMDCYAASPNDINTALQTIYAGQDVRICFKFDYTGPATSAITRIQLDDEAPFDVNASFTPGTYVYSFPWVATFGDHRIRGWCDFNDEVDENSEGNNHRDENPSFSVLIMPDFNAVDCYAANPNNISTPLQTIIEGQDVNICFKFDYTGSEATAVTRIQLDSNTPIDVEQTFTEGTHIVSFSWVATLGDHQIQGWCDFNDGVTEADEGNNYRDEDPGFSVSPIPQDFAAVDCYAASPNDIFTPLQTVNEGQDVNICFKFDYTGPGTIAATRIQLDNESPFDVNGSFTDGTFVYSFPWTATFGEHRVRGWCDFNDMVAETNETNNYLDKNPCFSVILPDLKLLIHCDGNDGSQSFVDSSPSGHIITAHGNAQVDTDIVKFGTGSLLLDGNGDYLELPDSNDWDIYGSSSDDWTIDLWVKHTDHVGTEVYMYQYENDTNRWGFYHAHGNGIAFYARDSVGTVVYVTPAGEITDLNWHHIALCKVGSEYGIYKDGIQVGYLSDSSTDTLTGSLYIGRSSESGGIQYFDGHLDEVRTQHCNYFNASPDPGKTDTITVPVQ